MEQKAVAILAATGEEIRGTLTTHHPASSYGKPVFVTEEGIALDDWLLLDVRIISEHEGGPNEDRH